MALMEAIDDTFARRPERPRSPIDWDETAREIVLRATASHTSTSTLTASGAPDGDVLLSPQHFVRMRRASKATTRIIAVLAAAAVVIGIFFRLERAKSTAWIATKTGTPQLAKTRALVSGAVDGASPSAKVAAQTMTEPAAEEWGGDPSALPL